MSPDSRIDQLKNTAYRCFPEKSNLFTRTLARIPVFFIAVAVGLAELFSKAKMNPPLTSTSSKTASVANELFLLLVFSPTLEQIKQAKFKPLKDYIDTALNLSDKAYPEQMYQEGISFNSQEAYEKNFNSTFEDYLSRPIFDIDHLKYQTTLSQNELENLGTYLQRFNLSAFSYNALQSIIDSCKTPYEKTMLQKLHDEQVKALKNQQAPKGLLFYIKTLEQEREAFEAFGKFQITQGPSTPLSLETLIKFKNSSFHQNIDPQILIDYLHQQILTPKLIELDFRLKAGPYLPAMAHPQGIQDFDPKKEQLKILELFKSPKAIHSYRDHFVINLENLMRPTKLTFQRLDELKAYLESKFHMTLFNSDLIKSINDQDIKKDLEKLIDEQVGSTSDINYQQSWTDWDFAKNLIAQKEAFLAYKDYKQLKRDEKTPLTLNEILAFANSSPAHLVHSKALFNYLYQVIASKDLKEQTRIQALSTPELFAPAFAQLDFLNPTQSLDEHLGLDSIGSIYFNLKHELRSRDTLIQQLQAMSTTFNEIIQNFTKNLWNLSADENTPIVRYLSDLVFDLGHLEKPPIKLGFTFQRIEELKKYLKNNYNCSTFNLNLIDMIEDPNVKVDLKALFLSQLRTPPELVQDLKAEKEALTALLGAQGGQSEGRHLTLQAIKEFEQNPTTDKKYVPYLLKSLGAFILNQYIADYNRDTTTVRVNNKSFKPFRQTLDQVKNETARTTLATSMWSKLFAIEHFNQIKSHLKGDVKRAYTLMFCTTQALNGMFLLSQQMRASELFEDFKTQHRLSSDFQFIGVAGSELIRKEDGSFLGIERSIETEAGKLLTKTTIAMELMIKTPYELMHLPYIMDYKTTIQEDGTLLITTRSSGLDPAKAQMERI